MLTAPFLPIGTTPVMTRTHPHWLKAYMHFTRTSEAPDAFHFWSGVGTIAGALRRRVWLDMRHFQWTPNFYIILESVASRYCLLSLPLLCCIGTNFVRTSRRYPLRPPVDDVAIPHANDGGVRRVHVKYTRRQRRRRFFKKPCPPFTCVIPETRYVPQDGGSRPVGCLDRHLGRPDRNVGT